MNQCNIVVMNAMYTFDRSYTGRVGSTSVSTGVRTTTINCVCFVYLPASCGCRILFFTTGEYGVCSDSIVLVVTDKFVSQFAFGSSAFSRIITNAGDSTFAHIRALFYLHCVQKKTPTYVFDYNSGVSWSIFILFVPVEREMITLQFTYLQS